MNCQLSREKRTAMSRVEFLAVLCLVLVLIDFGSRYVQDQPPFQKRVSKISAATNRLEHILQNSNLEITQTNLETNFPPPVVVVYQPVKVVATNSKAKREPGPQPAPQFYRLPDGKFVKVVFPQSQNTSPPPVRIAVP